MPSIAVYNHQYQNYCTIVIFCETMILYEAATSCGSYSAGPTTPYNSKVSDSAPDVASSKSMRLRAVALRLMNFGNPRTYAEKLPVATRPAG